jgi:hypothetical protein
MTEVINDTGKTTIQIDTTDKDRLDTLSSYPREPYASIVKRILDAQKFTVKAG